jgi:hypothetical protein
MVARPRTPTNRRSGPGAITSLTGWTPVRTPRNRVVASGLAATARNSVASPVVAGRSVATRLVSRYIGDVCASRSRWYAASPLSNGSPAASASPTAPARSSASRRACPIP